MSQEKENSKKSNDCCSPKDWHKHHHHHDGGGMGAIYFLGMIGVAVYNVQQVAGFWPGVLGVIKAFIWPAFLLYKVFQMLHM